MTFVHSLSAYPSSLAPVRGPGASRVCSTLLCYNARVPQELAAHDGPAASFACYADVASYIGYVGDPCSHVPLSGDAQHAAPAGPPHTTRRNHAQCDVAVPPVRPAGARFPMPRVGSSSEDKGQLEGGQAETKASDGQGQRRTDHFRVRKWQCGSDRPADRLCQSRVCQEGCVPGATDGSMPVGSAKVLSAPFPAGLMRLQRIRPLEHFTSSSVLELRWQQALLLDHGVDPFDSAFFHALFPSREHCRQGLERSRAPTQHPSSKRLSLASSTFAPLFSLINRFSQCLFLNG
jgi:hypothetical protein